ncbi:hypothetical protein ONZ45_g11065 [Pleurotus djamor]|nr:hypothetical protein ONZ45_g11065 [Pleurotus djamor]
MSLPAANDIQTDLAQFPSAIIARPTSLTIEQEIASAAISCVEYIGSYNWIDNEIPSILVPGLPKEWISKRMPFTLERDVGVMIADQNNHRSLGRPLLPLVIAVNTRHGMDSATDRPIYNWPSVDIITGARSLRRLHRWINDIPGPPADADFRIDLQLAGEKTVLMNWFSENVKQMASFGFGHGFEAATTKSTSDCELGTNAGHYRICQYDFGGLKMVVRCEVDAYLPHGTKTSVNELADSLAEVNIRASPRSEDATFVSGIAVYPSGSWSLPQSSIVEITTRSFWNYQNLNWSDVYPQIYLSQTPHLFIGLHHRGTFTRLVQENLGSPPMRRIYAAEQPKMKMLRWLLGDIQKRLRKHGPDAKISLVCRGGVLGVYERDSYDDCLPEEVLDYFNGSKGGQVASIDWPEGIIHVASIMSRPMLISEFVPLSQDGTSPLYRMMHFDNNDYTWISYNGIITVARRQRAQRIQASDLICRVEYSTEGIYLKVYEKIGVYLLDAIIAVSLIYLRQSSRTAVN